MLYDLDKSKIAGYTRLEFEQLFQDAKMRFDQIRGEVLDNLLWTQPKRARFMLGNENAQVNGYHIFDSTHVLAQRSCVAGFLEGNTSASRPWIRFGVKDLDKNLYPANREYLDKASRSALGYLGGSNFYHEAGQFYYDWTSTDTGAHIFKRRNKNSFHVYTLLPGSYYIINNAFGEAEMLFRSFTLHAVALVKRYGKKKNGEWDWSNFSTRVKELYERSDTTVLIECVEVYCRNKNWTSFEPQGGRNRQWTSVVYETGVYSANGFNKSFVNDPQIDMNGNFKYLEVNYYKRRPFVVGKAQGDIYGERGPTTDSKDLIRSLNKKAVSKDLAIEKMLDPTTQGPAGIRKSYLTTQARGFIPLDPTALAQGGMKTVYDIPVGFNALVGDVEDMRRQVEKMYYADFLLFLSSNPKTRTATEAAGVMEEQKSVLGPMLQSLNWSYNTPIAEYALDFALENDPELADIPDSLSQEWINTEFVSPFAQAQRAFDLPQINSYVDRWVGLAQLNPAAWNNINLNKLAEIYEDRYQLPSGLNNPKSAVEALMKQAQAQQQRQQLIDSLPAVSQANKNTAQAQQIGMENQANAEEQGPAI
jgi:hypothetical protein